jgi:hypothetical protein
VKLAEADLALCRGIVSQTLQELSAAFGNTEASEVMGPLVRCASRLRDEPPASAEEIALLIRTTVSAGLGHVARSHLEWKYLEGLSAAYDAVHRRPPEESSLLGFAPAVESQATRRAMWSPPGKLRPWAPRLMMPPELKKATASEAASLREQHRLALEDVDVEDAGTDSGGEPEAEPATEPRAAPMVLYDANKESVPPVRFDPELASCVPLFQHYALVGENALDTLALLNRHRLERSIAESQDEEMRMWALLDAALTTGPALVENTERWWAQNLDSPDDWKVWAPCYVLGSLEDQGALLALDRVLDDLDPETKNQGIAAAQGLHLSRGSGRALLLKELRRSANPLKRAVGVRASSLAAELSAEEIALHLADPGALVVEAALDAAARITNLPIAQQDTLVPFLRSGVPVFVRGAAKALLMHGRPEPSMDLAHGNLETSLGPYLLEFLVWNGSEYDLPRIERFVQGRELTGEQLIQIGLFGHPATWAFLAHFLSDEDLQDDANDALTLLLGVGVDSDNRFEREAWEAQLQRVAPDSRTRFRLGKPFSVQSVHSEHQLRRTSYRELEKRLEEASIRTGTRVDAPLHGWTADAEGRLQTELLKLHQLSSTIRAGTWDSRCRTL